MNVAVVQMEITWEDKPANFARVRALLDAAHIPRGALVALPEMFATGFSMNVAAIAEEVAGPTARFLADTASYYGIYLLGGVVTRSPDGRGRNQAVVFAPDGTEVARYHKMHPFTFGGESAHYAAGYQPTLFRWGEWTVAPFICYDLRFPEVFRHATCRGAQLFVVIANWPEAREAHWITLLRARAIENQAYVVGVNRCGSDPQLTYRGRSLIVDPRGEIRADAGTAETVVSAAVDQASLLDYRREFPVLSDIHPHFVGAAEPRSPPRDGPDDRMGV